MTMSNLYSARALANTFLELAKEEGKSLSPLQLQKLVYYAHGWNLGIRNAPLIDAPIEAWRFGPVVQSLYHEFKEYGNNPITSPAQDLRIKNGLPRDQH